MPPGLTVVLVEPEQGVNVGFVARTMACYGLTDLRIVRQLDFTLDDGAKKTAKGAGDLLQSISYYDNLSAAISDCHFSFGFTRRTREPTQKIGNVKQTVLEWQNAKSSSSKTALVFGRESQGLSREETMVLSHLVRIDFAHETLSLNVSHAVAIALFAFSESNHEILQKRESQFQVEKDQEITKAFHGDQAQTLVKLFESLEAKGFFRSGKEAAQKDFVRLLWQRLQPTQSELDFLAGMLKRLSGNS